MIELAKKFVPTTDEVWLLQNGKSPECKLFQKMAANGHYRTKNKTKQGMYVCTPGGEFLASVNSNNPDRVMAMMREGLQAWNALKPDQRIEVDASIEKPDRRAEASEPDDGLILAVYARDLPDTLDPNSQAGEKWNRDTAWFSKQEALELIPGKREVGQSLKFPQPLVNRLVALHLVDAVKGQTEHYASEDVQDSEIVATITDVASDTVTMELAGKTTVGTTRSTRRSSPHGVATRLLGRAEFDLKKLKFTQFEIVALGRRWGHTRFNFRREENRESNPIGFVLQLAPEDEPPIVPAFYWAYKSTWMK